MNCARRALGAPPVSPITAWYELRGSDGFAQCGDAIEIRELDDGTVVVAVVDIAGHGRALAMLSAYIATHLLAVLTLGGGPAKAMALTDGEFRHERGPNGPAFATAFAARIDPATGRILYASAGHEPAMLIAPDATVSRLAANGPALGVLDQPCFAQNAAFFAPADQLVVVSDGVTESRDGFGRMFGLWGVAHALAAARGASAAARAIVRAAAAHSPDGLHDDACALVLEFGKPAQVNAPAARCSSFLHLTV